MLAFYLTKFDNDEDIAKFTALYKRYCGPMLKIANKYINNYVLAEDCVHSAFLDVADNIENIGDVDNQSTKSYLFSIVRTKSINMFKKETTQANIGDYENERISQQGETLEDEFFEQQDIETLKEKITELPEELRAPLIFRYGYGEGYQQIASHLGISPENARKRVQRAKDALRMMIKKDEK